MESKRFKDVLIRSHQEKLKSEQKLPLAAALALASLAEFWLFFSYSQNSMGLSLIIPLHLIISLALFALTYIYQRVGFDIRLPIVSAFFTLALGPYGASLSLLMLILYSIYKRMTSELEVTVEEFFPIDPEDELSKKVYERIRFGLDVFDPERIPYGYEAVMLYGTEAQKRRALERILKFFRPEFCKPLMIALRDKSNAVRVLAATAVSRIDQQYGEKIQHLENEIKHHPNEVDRLLEYGEECEWQSKIVVFDPERQNKMLGKAYEAYNLYSNLFPENEKVIAALGRLSCQMGDYDQAIAYYRKILQPGKPVTDEIIQWAMRALFHQKRYDDIRKIARDDSLVVKGEMPDHDLILESVLLWKRGLQPKQMQVRISK